MEVGVITEELRKDYGRNLSGTICKWFIYSVFRVNVICGCLLENPYILRELTSTFVITRDMRLLFGLTQYTAQKWLKYFCEKGIMMKEGTKHSPIYFLKWWERLRCHFIYTNFKLPGPTSLLQRAKSIDGDSAVLGEGSATILSLL